MRALLPQDLLITSARSTVIRPVMLRRLSATTVSACAYRATSHRYILSNRQLSTGSITRSAAFQHNAIKRLPGIHPNRFARFLASSTSAPTNVAPASHPIPALVTLEAMPWNHTLVNELPADPDTRNVVRQVEGALFSFVSPTPPSGAPYLISYSPQVARLIGLDPSECERPEFPLLMSGAAPLPGARPYAACYGGHQFGAWAGQLGDGRAITLGELLAPWVSDPWVSGGADGAGGQSLTQGSVGPVYESGNEQPKAEEKRLRRWELQLKGAGKTPYSRRADGRAVLRSSLREYVASEAMAALGVPTTRALCLVGTGDPVLRDMFYNGNAKLEPGAVVARVAPSFMRFGTFQLPASRGRAEVGLIQMAADWLIKYHLPHLQGSPSPYLSLLQEVVASTGRMVARWQVLGFVHGVLNSDNMSVMGLTIDYGPFGFLDTFDPDWTPNLTDASGRRYSYRNQPEAAQFNLIMFANALLAADLLPREGAEEALKDYSKVLSETYNDAMAAKLGLLQYDRPLITELLQLMYEDDADFTNTFRALCGVTTTTTTTSYLTSPDQGAVPAVLLAALNCGRPLAKERVAAWVQWLQAYRARLRAEGRPDPLRQSAQRSVCPKYIPRQHLMHAAITAAEGGEYGELEALLAVLERPYDEQPDVDPKYSSPPPREMQRPGVCMLSCSS